VSVGMCSAVGNREPTRQRIRRFGYSVLAFFVVTLTFGVLVVLVMSASACAWNAHVRCFSISRDTLGMILIAAEIWGMLAVAVALFAATAQIYRALTWSSAFIVVPVSVLVVGMLPIRAASLAKEAISEPFFFFAVGLVLLAAYQLSLFISRLFGKLHP